MQYPEPLTNVDGLPKAYGGILRERFWQDYWRAAQVYRFSPTRADGTPYTRSEIYSVDTPPPTVSGALHIGHVFSYTQTDFSVRYQRMKGKVVFYPFCFDDNGLPSERLVERITGKRAFEVGREAFIELCKPILAAAEKEFTDLWQSLALSCDWDQFYTTINDRSRAISQASFIDLYNKGYVYRKEAPTMWCWADQTAIAQAEIEDREVPGHFHDIVFHWADGPGEPVRGELIIATTRPELIPACVAVFVNPNDDTPLYEDQPSGLRKKDLIGKVAITPLFEVEVRILPSEKADPEKGTGILMCCTFGDTDDVEHWEMHNLPTKVVIGRDGCLADFRDHFGWIHDYDSPRSPVQVSRRQPDGTESTPPPALRVCWRARDIGKAQALADQLAGRKIKAAQDWIREALRSTGLLKSVREITHIVRHSERGGVPIEILLTPQWYIRVLDFKDKLVEQGRKLRWYPEYMFKRYEHWVEGLNQDWCISRQRFNGVPFPLWYDVKDEPILAELSQLPVNPLASRPRGVPEAEILRAEPDVMDTWATSSLTPLLCTQLVIGWDEPDIAARHAQLYPMDLRPQAHDIIRTWAFYTITKAFFHFGVIPWKDIVISGHAQDIGHKKISKSKGHVVTPADLVEKYTADGLRYWSSGCKLGTDTLYDEKVLGEGKRLITKLFNASKFTVRHLLDFDPHGVGARRDAPSRALPVTQHDLGGSRAAPTETGLLPLVTYPTDRWVLFKLAKAIERATKAHEEYEFGDAKQAAEDFFWADFCDNYLELCKGRLYGEMLAVEAHPKTPDDALRQSAQAALFICLSAVLRLFAPVLPHIAEECWSWYFARFHEPPSIHLQPWPALAAPAEWEQDAAAGEMLVNVLAAVRKWKSERNVSIKKKVSRLNIYRGTLPGVSDRGAPLASVMGDLLSTANADKYSLLGTPAPPDAATTSGNPFSVACELAEEA